MSDDLHHLVTVYALDALDGDERLAFEEHLASCAACRDELDGLRAVTGALGEDLAAPPPAPLRAAVLARISETPQEPRANDLASTDEPVNGGANISSLAGRRARRRPTSAVLAVAAAIVLVVAGGLLYAGTRGGDAYDDVVAAPDAVTSTLVGDAGTVELVWSPERDQVAVSAAGLAPPEPGFVYELWAVVEGRPVPAGLFETDDGSLRDVADLDDIADEASPTAWGITIEPDGGSAAPTGEILYFAEL